MSELPKNFDAKAVEAKWYAWWLEHGMFRGDAARGGEPYCIVIPPPNVTGILHMGHALNNTLQDVLIRWRRMQGRNTLWVPGTDHAGIATQNVVERELKEEGKRRDDLGREKFVERVWQWKEQYGNTIISQLKSLGCSCDWDRLRFTMDEGLASGKGSFYPPLRKGADLPRQIHHQLVPALPDGVVRRRKRASGSKRQALPYPVSAG